MTDEAKTNGDLLSITSIREAAEAMAAFQAPQLPVAGGHQVTINKLPDDKFRALLNQLLSTVSPYLVDKESPDAKPLDAQALMGLLQEAPRLVDDLLKFATDFHSIPKCGQLPTDVRLLCAAAVLMVSYLDNPAIRVFITAVRRVRESVGAESAAAASDAPAPAGRS